MPIDAGREAVFVRYLLDELPEGERDQLESEFLANSLLHEQLLAAEDELIYAYVRGDLAASRRQSFERLFLNSAERLSRVEFARTFSQFLEVHSAVDNRREPAILEGESPELVAALVPSSGPVPPNFQRLRAADLRTIWQKSWDAFRAAVSGRARIPAGRLALAAVAVAICVVSVIVVRYPKHTEFAQNRPAPVYNSGQPPKADSPALGSPAPSLVPANPSAIRPSPSLSKSSPVSRLAGVIALTLVPTERGSGQENVLVIPEGEHTVRLRFQAIGDGYRVYRAAITTLEQRRVTEPTVHRISPEQLYIELSSKFLASGDYILRLYGTMGVGATPEEVAAYSFRVVQGQQK